MTQYDQRITAYFGDAVLQAGFMPLPHLFLRHYRKLGLSQVQAMFVLHLMEIAWDFGDPPNTVTKLAQRMGVTTRSIQLCSQEVHALGLVEIYEQFEPSGAQVENGYDLSPLFQRLSTLVPAVGVDGQARLRRSRSSRLAEKSPGAPNSQPDVVVEPPKNLSPVPLKLSSFPPPKEISSAPGVFIQPTPAVTFVQTLNSDSALKVESKNHFKKQTKITQDPAAAEVQTDKACVLPVASIVAVRSYSSGRHTPLHPDEVAQSRAVLDRIGLNTAVVTSVAQALRPTEVWALWSYARGARLGPAWIATQVYDFAARRPQASAVGRPYEAASELLLTLPLEIAESLLDLCDQQCPPASQGFLAPPPSVVTDELQQQAFTALWAVMAEQRSGRAGHSSTPLPQPTSAKQPPAAYPPVESSHWVAAQARLARELAPEAYTTWVKPTVLLALDDETAVIGTPNVFVRDQVLADYRLPLEAVLMAELGRRVRVEVVINSS